MVITLSTGRSVLTVATEHKPLVVVIGAGALGSNLVLAGRNWPAEVRVVDFDRVESKNIDSQFHTYMGMGKNKAVALQAAMMGLFKLKIDTKPTRLSSDNAKELVGSGSLVVDCTDNYVTRRFIQYHAQNQRDVQCLHCCLSTGGDVSRVVWTEHFVADPEGEEGQATCEDGQNLPFHILTAALAAQVVQRYLSTGERQSWQLTPYKIVRIA